MRLLVLAWRNLLLHRVKSLLIGLIMGLGVAVLFVGNAMIDTAIEGMRKLFVEGFTGDFMVTGPSRQSVTIFGEASSGLETDELPRIEDAPALAGWLASREGVLATCFQLSGKAEIGRGEDPVGIARLFGIDAGSYRSFFPGQVELLEGSWPPAESRGWILLSSRSAELLEEAEGRPVALGDRLLLSSLSETAGTVIREVEVAGLVRFRQSNPELSGISLCQADTLRDILGFASLEDEPVALDAEQIAFVQGFDPEALFDEGIEAARTLDAASAPGAVASGKREPLGTRGAEGRDSTSAGADPSWQYILVRLDEGVDAAALMDATRSRLRETGVEARVQDWVAGAGRVASMALSVRLVFDLLVSVVGVIVVIVAMNALVISIGERLGEIGTMRALGAQRLFVSALIGLETALLALVSGAAGLLAGGLALALASRSGIEAPSYFFEALFGGPLLSPRPSWGAALKALAWILGMSLISSIYPIRLALRVQPSAAMGSE